LKKEGNETVTNCNALKLKAKDGKYRMTDVDGFVIYYGGDNADWGDGDEANIIHYQEIDYF
jgi:hypothetical protein